MLFHLVLHCFSKSLSRECNIQEIKAWVSVHINTNAPKCLLICKHEPTLIVLFCYWISLPYGKIIWITNDLSIQTTCKLYYRKTCLKRPLKKKTKIGFQYLLSLNAGQKYCRMLQGEHSAILSTFIKLPSVIKIFVLSIFEWPLKTGFTAHQQFAFFCSAIYLKDQTIVYFLKSILWRKNSDVKNRNLWFQWGLYRGHQISHIN